MAPMIAYEILVQTIADWKAGVRPTAPGMPPNPAAPEVVEELESGVVDIEEQAYDGHYAEGQEYGEGGQYGQYAEGQPYEGQGHEAQQQYVEGGQYDGQYAEGQPYDGQYVEGQQPGEGQGEYYDDDHQT